MGIKNFLGRGYLPCNEEADKLLEEIVRSPAEAGVVRPWEPKFFMTGNAKICAIQALSAGEVGVARKPGTEKYKCYYRRSHTGNWLAEVWGTLKSTLVAAAIVTLTYWPVKWLKSAHLMRNENYEGLLLALFVMGVVTCACFMGRAILGFGIHYRVAETVGGKVQAAGVINLSMSIYGVALIVMSLSGDWSLGKMFAWVGPGYMKLLPHNYDFYSLLNRYVEWIAYVLFWGVFFTWLSFAWFGAKMVRWESGLSHGVSESEMAKMYSGSFVEKAQSSAHPQNLLAMIAYVAMVGGGLLMAVQNT